VLPDLGLVWADGGCPGRLVRVAKAAWRITLAIVHKLPEHPGFAALPRRWVVGRTFAWTMRCRRLVRDFERTPRYQEALVRWAMVGLMLRRLAPAPGRRPGADTRL